MYDRFFVRLPGVQPVRRPKWPPFLCQLPSPEPSCTWTASTSTMESSRTPATSGSISNVTSRVSARTTTFEGSSTSRHLWSRVLIARGRRRSWPLCELGRSSRRFWDASNGSGSRACTPACTTTGLGDRVFDVPEEKRTDVNIAIHMLDDAYQGSCEQQILVSGDSDLVPALQMVRHRFPAIRTVVYVPARTQTRGRAFELRRAAHHHRDLPLTLLAKAQFPTRVADGTGGFIEKPTEW